MIVIQILFIKVEKIKGVVFDHENADNVLINYEQFMEIMTSNIIKNREKYGKENIVFESGNKFFKF
jgi:hypothetical protein